MTPLRRLHVTALRYRSATLASGDGRGLDAIAASGVYDEAGVPFEVSEPRLPDDMRTGVELQDLAVVSTQGREAAR